MESQVSVVSVKEKKEFIRWFLKRYMLESRPAVWILNYLITHEELLKSTSFVDDASKYKRGMIISAVNKDNNLPSFKFYKGNVQSADAEKAFHDMRLHPDESLHIQLNFKDKDISPEYSLVDESYNSSEDLSPVVLEEAEKIMTDLQRQMLLKAIDVALDSDDEKLFVELCKMLNEVGQKKTLSFSG